MSGDPWQARLDRLRVLLPLPLLAVSTVGAVLTPGQPSQRHGAATAAVVGGAALWSAVLVFRLRPDASSTWRLTAFVVHSALAGVLVWTNSWYGVFAYTGFLFAYPLGRRWRVVGFALTSLVVTASMTGGYPSGDLGRTTTYLVVAAVMVSLVLISATITNHAIEQNVQRGQVIAELAETNRRLESALAENAELHEQLVAQAREAGVQEERQRLAGEIHDTLAQGLTGIITQLGAAEQTRHRPAESDRHLTLARELARDSLTEARRSVHALRPEQLETAGLPAALADLARTWSRQTAVAAELETCGEPERAPAEVEAALFRVAQEALANVGKHSGASKTRLTLTYLDGTVLLDVHDDGAGFVTGRRTDGYGLVGMRTRLDKVGGVLTVESGPGVGTTVNAFVPLRATS